MLIFYYDDIIKYIRDAEIANESDLVELWETIRNDRQKHVQMLKDALEKRFTITKLHLNKKIIFFTAFDSQLLFYIVTILWFNLEIKNVIRFISLREKIDKVKGDALAHLSDQLLVPKRIFNNSWKGNITYKPNFI